MFMIKYTEELKCKKCGKDISIKSFNLLKFNKYKYYYLKSLLY